jgi:hypothetical protein
MRIRPARGFIAWYLRRAGFAGITLPPLGIYILPHRLDDARLRRHEIEHWRQYRERGVVRFYVEYLWLLWRHGYHDHPFERAAREAERDPIPPI